MEVTKMADQDLSVSQPTLVAAWNENLPFQLHQSDSFSVRGDSANSQALNIHVDTAGRTKYSFDFKCTYLDDRSVRVDLIDVEKDDESIDERTTIVQDLVEDYVRHIHECAQAVQSITHD
jgi:hypothetical protein